MINIIDYNLGNIRSLSNALTYLGVDFTVSGEHSDIKSADALILPGVGSFEDGMSNLQYLDLINIIRDQVISENKPIFGICLGFQLLFKTGYEYCHTQGLGLLDGDINRLRATTTSLRIPHMGWNSVHFPSPTHLFHDIDQDSLFYFIHSYCLEYLSQDFAVGTTEHGEKFVSAISSGNIHGTQFHPEKSQKAGIQLLNNFITSI